MQRRFKVLAAVTILIAVITSCGTDDTAYPRPRGHFRIDFPEKSYQPLKDSLPFTFEYPKYSHITGLQPIPGGLKFQLHYGWYGATLWCSYHNDTNLISHVENARELAYKHTEIAKKIEPIPFRYDSAGVYGVEYLIKGEKVATPYSFYAMDSTRQFFRGSLYFDKSAYTDSLAPVLDYLQQDLKHMLQSLRWTAVN